MYQSKIRDSKKRGAARSTELLEPDLDNGQSFALVQAMTGNGRLTALLESGKIINGRIAGSLRKYSKKVIISRGDLVLISHRDFEDKQVDVIGKYTHDQMNQFLKKGVLPEKIAIAITHAGSNSYGVSNEAEDHLIFAEEEVDESVPKKSDKYLLDNNAIVDSDSDADSDDSIDIDAI